MASFTSLTASPSDTPGARLNESVTTGNCPWWFTASGAGVVSMRVNWLIGTIVPAEERR